MGIRSRKWGVDMRFEINPKLLDPSLATARALESLLGLASLLYSHPSFCLILDG